LRAIERTLEEITTGLLLIEQHIILQDIEHQTRKK